MMQNNETTTTETAADEAGPSLSALLCADKQDDPCLMDDGEYDHQMKYIDDSFSHEYGTEICGHLECERCGALEDGTAPDYDYDLGN